MPSDLAFSSLIEREINQLLLGLPPISEANSADIEEASARFESGKYDYMRDIVVLKNGKVLTRGQVEDAAN